jgi:hypothetical protein
MSARILSGFFSVLTVAVVSLAGGAAYGHGGASRVEMDPLVVGAVPPGALTYSFELLDDQTHKPLGDDDLSISHEKKIHLMVYDAALREFQHVHPEFKDGVWQVNLDFTVAGEYWIWAQGRLKDGADFSVTARLRVEGGQAAWPLPPELRDTRTGAADFSVATLDSVSLRAGQMAMPNLTLTRNNGTEPQLTPYLGAFAHVMAVHSDGQTLVHVHPIATGRPNVGMLHMTFPKSGLYRLWVQFIDGGVLRTVSLAVEVQ